MNEYRTPELNVQNGVLKSLSFLFEYIQEMGKVWQHFSLLPAAVNFLTFDVYIGLRLRSNSSPRRCFDGP